MAVLGIQPVPPDVVDDGVFQKQFARVHSRRVAADAVGAAMDVAEVEHIAHARAAQHHPAPLIGDAVVRLPGKHFS